MCIYQNGIIPCHLTGGTEGIMRDVGEDGGSVDFNELNIHGHLIRGLRYTDDTILLSHCARGLSYLVETLDKHSGEKCLNRPFYRYGDHIELIRFKEYYRMPRGHEHIWFAFSSAFRDIFS